MSEIRAWLEAFGKAATKKGFEEHRLLETSAGPLTMWMRIEPNAPIIYLSAGMHGDEPAGPPALLRLLEEGAFCHGISWWLSPVLNPTGLAIGTRENDRGIDQNRDYRLRQSAEVIAHAGWLEGCKAPAMLLSLHEDWESSGFYFYEINLEDDIPERAHSILEAVRATMPIEPNAVIDDHDVREPGWIYHAAEADLPDHWPEAIFLAKLGCPLTFTFETPSSLPLVQRIEAHCAAVRRVLSAIDQ